MGAETVPQSFIDGCYVSKDLSDDLLKQKLFKSLETDSRGCSDTFEDLRSIASVYRGSFDEIVETCSEETGYPVKDCESLLQVLVEFLNSAEEKYEDLKPQKEPQRFSEFTDYDREISRELRPRGDLLIITPANATLPIAGITAASALAAGNRVTVRPSGRAEKTAFKLLKPFAEKFPERFNLVYASAKNVTDRDTLEKFDAVHYTGSSKYYSSIKQEAAEARTKAFIEGEGNGVFIVDGRPEEAAETLVRSLTRCNGRLCTTPSGVKVRDEIEQEFRDSLEQEVKDINVGSREKRETDLAQSAESSETGEVFVSEDPLQVLEKSGDLDESEIHGPTAWIETFSDPEAVIDELKERDHGLTATVFTDRPEDFRPRTASTSRICFNADPTLQSPLSPWGATGESGESPGNTFMEKFSRSVIEVEEETGGDTFQALVTESSGETVLKQLEADDSYTGIVARNLWSGVCGTDRAILSGDMAAAFPLVQGHENISEVVSGSSEDVYGEKVEPGDYIIWTAVSPCGKCRECRSGKVNMCATKNFNGLSKTAELKPHAFGGWSEKSFVNRRTLMVKIDKERAQKPVYTLVEPLATLVNLEVKSEDVLIVGGGALGSLFAAVLSGQDGLKLSVSASEEKFDVLDQFTDENIRREDEIPESNFDTVVNATGSAEVFRSCLDHVKPGGRILEISVLDQSMKEIDVSKIAEKSLTVEGKSGYTEKDLRDAFEFVKENEESLEELVETEDFEEAGFDSKFKKVLDVGDC